MTDTPYKKKLIEVSLPLDAINAESARENFIFKKNPSSIHKWWAQRPLAASRAVIFAQLVDDPSCDLNSTPEEQDVERLKLFALISELVKWDNANDDEVLAEARAAIVKSCGADLPSIIDPFSGGGTIPLEAQRLGLRAQASDLNPVAVVINRALLEVPLRWDGHGPVHPDAALRQFWKGPEGLAEDLRLYGHWVRDQALQEIGHLYPEVVTSTGESAKPLAWIWARTITCPNPACGATMPLVKSFWLGKKKGKEAWVKVLPDGKQVQFEICNGSEGPKVDGTVTRSTGARCLSCQETTDFKYIRAEGQAGRIGSQLMAIVVQDGRRRVYLPADNAHTASADVDRPESVPLATLEGKTTVNVGLYGFESYADLFTKRQLVALTTLCELVGKVRSKVLLDSEHAGMGPTDANLYADALILYLSLAVSKYADYGCSFTVWDPGNDRPKNMFARHAIPMVWDFPEVNPFGSMGGTFDRCVGIVAESIPNTKGAVPVEPTMTDARQIEGNGVICTDPPYYDNIGYADLSDFFYVWLRRLLKDVYPDLFATMVTPKTTELIATPYRHDGSKDAAERYFEDGFVEVFERCREIQPDGYPMTLFYAFKQSESGDEGNVSTGWATMLEGLLTAGWMVTATWPIRSERGSRMISIGSNALASSIVLACRPRSESSGITDRQGLIRALREELPGLLGELQKANIAPVDLRQAAIGPGMAVFSRFSRVVEPDGEAMRVRTALGLINQMLDQVLNEQDAEFDSKTRWAIQWFTEFFEDEGPYGKAEQLATSMDVAVDGMVQSGVLKSGEGKVRLLSRDEMPSDWDPRNDLRTPIWEACQHLVRRLETDGEESAGRLLRNLGGVGDSAHLLAYRLYSICETQRPKLAGPYNALVASWPEIQRISRQVFEPAETTEQSALDL